MLKKTDFAEKRQFGRRQTSSRGWIKIAGRPSVQCLIVDLSQGGAAIECETGTWLPYNFRVISEALGLDRMCEIRNQQQNRFGVEFVEHAKGVAAGRTGIVDDAAQWTSAPHASQLVRR